MRTGITLARDALGDRELNEPLGQIVVGVAEHPIAGLCILADGDEISATRRGDLLIEGNAGQCFHLGFVHRLGGIVTQDIPDSRILGPEAVQRDPSRMERRREPDLVG